MNLRIVPFEGTPEPLASMLASDLAAHGIAARIDAPASTKRCSTRAW